MKPIHAIETDSLVKRYKQVTALNGMSLRVPQGSLCGLIGLNGAGKTTTLRILLGMAKADSGSAKLFGLNALAPSENRLARTRIGYIPEQKELYPYMTPAQLLRFTASFYPTWNQSLADHYAKTFDIPLARPIPQLSKGNLTKLHLLHALARGAELLVLDEPTDGLDAVASEEAMQALVTIVAEQGVTVLICSHRLEELEKIADHVCLVHRGQCLRQDSLDDIRAATRRIHGVLTLDPGQRQALSQLGILKADGRAFTLLVETALDSTLQLLREWGATDLTADPVPLRELFLTLVRQGDANHAVA